MTPFVFGTKAESLSRLKGRLHRADLADQEYFSVASWARERASIVSRLCEGFAGSSLAVRSCAVAEDGDDRSMAGSYHSILGVEPSPNVLSDAIDVVIDHYTDGNPENQVLVQPLVRDVVISGVVMTKDLDTGSPYYVVNYDDYSGRTDSVTGGGESKSLFVHRNKTDALHSPRMRALMDAVLELEHVIGREELDIEFCITRSGRVFVLQVRPIAAKVNWSALPGKTVDDAIVRIEERVAELRKPENGVFGSTTIFGEMPDWNPAEMIGTTPRPLALSLYKRLITDDVWSRARANLGYRNAGKRPLLKALQGRPYIDVRLSLNSFLPAKISHTTSKNLVDLQLDRLSENRDFHDKLEFRVAITCMTADFNQRIAHYLDRGLRPEQAEALRSALAQLTERLILQGPAAVSARCEAVRALDIDATDRSADTGLIARLIANCRAFGTLPFSELARHAFIAVANFKALVRCGALTQDRYDAFLKSFHTVAGEFILDLGSLRSGALSQSDFLARHGHLRPGTYDILSPSYDEAPETYLSSEAKTPDFVVKPLLFELSVSEARAIEACLRSAGMAMPASAFLAYAKAAIQARETAKHIFTRDVSNILKTVSRWAVEQGIERQDAAFLTIEDILQSSSVALLQERIDENREAYRVTRAVRLPHLVCDVDDVRVVRVPIGKPTYISGKKVVGPTCLLGGGEQLAIDEKIVLIEGADPGFDWIFSHKVKGLVTKYGGANSHMAIRCAEFGLPAAIGCGERIFDDLRRCDMIELDCASQTLRAVS